MTQSVYNYKFKNGTITVSKGIETKFDWLVSVKLNQGFICLDKKIFLTKKEAKTTTEKLLKKYNLL